MKIVESKDLDPRTVPELLSDLNERGFRRLSRNIAGTWGTEECESYIEDLMKDDRGDRAGFPKPVFIVLMQLYLKHGNEEVDAEQLAKEYL